MKKILGLFALVGAAAAAVSMIAKRRGQDIGQFTEEWAERAKDAATAATETAGTKAGELKDAAADAASTLKDGAGDLAEKAKDAAVDLRDGAESTKAP